MSRSHRPKEQRMRNASRGISALLLLPALLVTSVPANAVGVTRRPAVPLAKRFVATVRGRVTDAESGQPIPSVQVAVVGIATLGAITNANGDYILRGVPSGTVVLRLSRIGYEPQRITVAVPG